MELSDLLQLIVIIAIAGGFYWLNTKEKNSHPQQNYYVEKINQLQKKTAQYQAQERSRELAFQDRIAKLEQSRQSLEDERQRIRRQDLQEQEQLLKERDRIWAEHESKVLSYISELCQTPELNFKTYDNNNLPKDLKGQFKPDFILDFLDQYLIFDAKSSRSENLQNYLADQVKKTAAKAAKFTKIDKTIFLVVPTQSISELKKYHYFEQGYSFYIISPEAIPAILASLKQIETYQFAEQMDPQERQNIINTIAELDRHISFSNTVQILLAQEGVDTLQKLQSINPQMLSEIDQQKTKMRLKNFTPTDLKKLISSTHSQQQNIKKMIDPKAAVSKSLK